VQAVVADIPPGLDDYERWEISLEPSPLYAK